LTSKAGPADRNTIAFVFRNWQKIPEAIDRSVLERVWSMYRITILVLVMLSAPIFGAMAERIQRKPPDEAERARRASEQVLNDGDLRTGDIISTDRGFFQIRGLNVDGSYDLAPVPNPLSPVKPKGR
jgi:hypothetical protein